MSAENKSINQENSGIGKGNSLDSSAETYPNLQGFNPTPATIKILRVGQMYALDFPVIGKYEGGGTVICKSRGDIFCQQCPLRTECPRPAGSDKPLHHNSIPREKIRVII